MFIQDQKKGLEVVVTKWTDRFSELARRVFQPDGSCARRWRDTSKIYCVRKPVSGLVAAAELNFSARPISRASRPASIAFLNAFAMRTGSEAIAIAVLTSTASAPISIASAA